MADGGGSGSAGQDVHLNHHPSKDAKQASGERISQAKTALGRFVQEKLGYVPSRCRYNPHTPFRFSVWLNILFASAACFTAANLYYSQPILNILARHFHVTNEEASHIPTLAQAGYATGLLFLAPLGDLVKRRPLILSLVCCTVIMWIGLCLTRSFIVFCVITFVTSVSSVTPQLMLPLVGELAPQHRRAAALSIASSGLLLGMLVARVLSGILTQFIGCRSVYWISFALQSLLLLLLYSFMPDYSSGAPAECSFRQYPSLIWDVLRLIYQLPVLAQACVIGFLTASTFTSFWTTLTFFLAERYHYDSLVIGLFSLIGIGTMAWGPICARVFMERYQPLFSVIVGVTICLIGIVIGTYSGHHNVVGPVVQAIFLDTGLQTSQTGNRLAIFQAAPGSRNRSNTAFMLSVFCGQLVGTAVGNHLYARGGWIRSGSASVGFAGLALVVTLLRGPHERGWIGWKGGYSLKKIVAPKLDVLKTTTAQSELEITKEIPAPPGKAPKSPQNEEG